MKTMIAVLIASVVLSAALAEEKKGKAPERFAIGALKIGQPTKEEAKAPGTFVVEERDIVFTAPSGEVYAVQRLPKKNEDGTYGSLSIPNLLPNGKFEIGSDGFDMNVQLERFRKGTPATFYTHEWMTFISDTIRDNPRN